MGSALTDQARLVDGYAKWTAGPNTVLVQTGDIVDRGRDTIALYRLFQDLSVKGTVVNVRAADL